MDQRASSRAQVTIIGHECPSRNRPSRRRCASCPPNSVRRCELAQAAVWDWQLAVDRFQVDEAWTARLRHRRAARRHGGRAWKRRIHPDDLGAFNAAARFLPARRRSLRVRIQVVSRRASLVVGPASRPGRATRARRRGRAHRRPAARHRPAQERGSRAQRQRVAPGHRVVGRARRVLAMARAQQCAHRESAVARDDRLFARAVGCDAESLVQQPALRGPRARRPAVARARAGRARFGRVRIPLQDRDRRIPLDAGSRPRRGVGPAGPPGAGHRRHARHRRREARRGAPAPRASTCSRPRPGARASACGKRISSPTPRAGSTTGAIATTSIPATAPITCTRWDENLHPDEGPEATRRFNEHVAGKAEYYDAEYRIRTRGGAWRWVFERGRVVERDANGKAVRMLGVCMDLDETQGRRAARQRAQRARRGRRSS